MVKPTDKILSPEFLLANGFIEIPYNCIEAPVEFPFYNDDDRYFIEKELDRQNFAVVFFYGAGGYIGDTSIFVQVDIGCGFIEIPNPFTETSEKEFCALFEAIRRESL